MTIGLLLPRSGLYPGINFDLAAGLKAGLQAAGVKDTTVLTESIGFATDDQLIYGACERMLLNGTALISGYVNPRTAEMLNPLFAGANRFFIALDSGYQFPTHTKPLSNVITITLQGALCCRAVARLAAEAGCRQFVYTGSYYEAGYRIPFTFARGVEDASGAIGFNHITALKKKEFTLAPLQQYLETAPPDALLAAFCGDMAEDFYREASSAAFLNLKTFVAPFMAEEQLLNRLERTGNNTHTVVPWSRALPLPENTVFLDAMQASGRTGSYFTLLGWEAGLVAGHLAATGAWERGSYKAFTLETPRGMLFFDPEFPYAKAPVYQAAITPAESTGKPELTGLKEIAFAAEERQRLQADIENTLHLQMDTWNNVYPCID